MHLRTHQQTRNDCLQATICGILSYKEGMGWDIFSYEWLIGHKQTSEGIFTAITFVCHRNAKSNLWVWHGKKRILMGFSISEPSSHVWARCSESCVTFQIAVSGCHLAFTWNGHMMSLYVYRIMSSLLSFFYFKRGLSIAWQYLTISLYKSWDIP